jgi:hypothetical protein
MVQLVTCLALDWAARGLIHYSGMDPFLFTRSRSAVGPFESLTYSFLGKAGSHESDHSPLFSAQFWNV